MDVHCANCGEPWDLYHLQHDAIWEADYLSTDEIEALLERPLSAKPVEEALKAAGYEFAGSNYAALLHCPCCPKDSKTDSQRSEVVSALAEIYGDDVDGMAADMEDLSLLDLMTEKDPIPLGSLPEGFCFSGGSCDVWIRVDKGRIKVKGWKVENPYGVELFVTEQNNRIFGLAYSATDGYSGRAIGDSRMNRTAAVHVVASIFSRVGKEEYLKRSRLVGNIMDVEIVEKVDA